MKLPVVPNYEVIELINSGGNAAVFKAIDMRTGYMVALKALFPTRAKDDFIRQRFIEESNYYLYLDHPNITKLVDRCEHGGDFYIAMEYVDGIPLNEYMNNVTGPLAEELLVPIFCEILETIDYLHNNNLLHLDIKPSNIMITENLGIKMLDMGISAKINDVKNNIKKTGSPSYMSPEQIQLKPFGRYTDIFALGVTLFNMVTGRVPFFGDSVTQIFENILTKEIPQISEYYPGANPQFQTIINKATQKDPMERYQTCGEFKTDIFRIQKNSKNILQKLK